MPLLHLSDSALRPISVSGVTAPLKHIATRGTVPTTVRAFLASEWPHYRALRLQALKASPDAFGSTWAEEQARPNAQWSERLREGVESGADLPLLALSADAPAGLCWSQQDADDTHRIHLFQMWVAPEHRGIGLGRQLLHGAIEWARARGAQSLCLGVTLGDSAALRLYRAAGFVAVGDTEVLRPGSALRAQAMRLALDQPQSR